MTGDCFEFLEAKFRNPDFRKMYSLKTAKIGLIIRHMLKTMQDGKKVYT